MPHSLHILRRKLMRLRYSFPMLLKKHAILLIIVLVLVLYLISYSGFFTTSKFVVKTKRLDDCVNSLLSPYTTKITNLDAVVFSYPLEAGDSKYLLYTGNGYFGAAWNSRNAFYIARKHGMGTPVPFSLPISVNLPGYSVLEKVGIDLQHGTLLRLSCFKQRSTCVSMEMRSYAHRVIPYLFVQEMSISNPTSNQLNLHLYKETNAWKKVQDKSIRVQVEGNKYDFKLFTGVVTGDSNDYIVAIAEPNFPPFVTVKPSSSVKHFFLTFMRYSERKKDSVKSSDINAFQSEVHVNAVKVLSMLTLENLRQSHQQAWSNLWLQGFSITNSLAPNALNGDRINSTLYYALTQKLYFPWNTDTSSLSLLSQLNVSNDASLRFSTADISRAAVYMHSYDRCFGGHDLFQVSALWESPVDEDALHVLVQRWLITLEKHGCQNLLSAGAFGLMQAALLAIGEFSFSGNHLEFNMHSSLLVRDITFKNIAYGPSASVNITVEVDDSNKALLFVSARGSKVFYACDAGCKDDPVTLISGVRTQLPLKITKPRTPLLYITPNRNHIEELKLAIHVQEIFEAPAHEHHVIALHKHGHPYGGLPLLFWIALISLILVFHLFLFKLIYSEYCKGQPVIPPYSKY